MPSATNPISEEEIDDILYFARANELNDLTSTLSSLASAHKCSIPTVLSLARDPGSGSSALHMACANNCLGIVKYLLAILSSSTSTSHASPLIDAPNVYGSTPLHYAAVNGHLDAVKLLLSAGADTNIQNNAGRHAVVEAESNEKTEVVVWLLSQMKETKDKNSISDAAEDDVDVKMEGETGLEQGVQNMEINEMP